MRRDGDHHDLANLVTTARAGLMSDADVDTALRRMLIERDPNRGLPPDMARAAVELLNNAPALHAAIGEVLLSPDDIADAMQETLLAISRSIHKFRGESSLQTWAVAIARRKAIDVLRRKRPGFTTGRADDPDHEDETARFSSRWATYADVATALNGLSPKLRQVFDMTEVQGMTYEEVASRLGVPRNTVASRLRRARTQLQLAIAPEL